VIYKNMYYLCINKSNYMKTLIKKHYGIDSVAKMTAMFQSEGKPFVVVDCAKFDFESKSIREVIKAMPSVIILDNLHRLSTADENKQERFKTFMDNIWVEVVGVQTMCDFTSLNAEITSRFNRTNIYFYKK
jgi:replication-associated recombination protein RarA